MSVFGRYAGWYDLFYADKDYRTEAAYVGGILRQHGVTGANLLEIGCGTGAHASWLVADGWQICGIDRSEAMLAQARARLGGREAMADFHLGDARDFDLGRQFDAAISLFHVMSYQAEHGDLDAALRAARRHLRPGGLFFFDFWHGPAVLAQQPEKRSRTVENAAFRVVRDATPTVHPASHIVDVCYDFRILDKADGSIVTLNELHRMRYLFADELGELATTTGFQIEGMLDWMGNCAPNEQNWNACAVLRADRASR